MSYQFSRGGRTACLSAGPVFILSLVCATIVQNPAQPFGLPTHWAELVGAVVVMALPVIVIGGLLAFLPVWLGASLLAWVGNFNAALRHPGLWSLSGGAIAAIPVIVVGAGKVFPEDIALIATGAICATLVRYGTRWSDESV